MAKVRLNPNFQREIARTAAYIHGLQDKAEEAARLSRSLAPVDTGAYRDSIGVVTEGGEVYVNASDFKARWIELGTVKQPPRAPLRRGAKGVGLKFKADR